MALGCGRRDVAPTTPQAAFEQFDRAMREGDLAAAAECFAYEHRARQQNPDWDEFPSAERLFIISTLKRQMQSHLRDYGPHYLAGEFKVESVTERGDTAVVTLTGREETLTVPMVKADGTWQILSGIPPRPGRRQ